ncbi:MAG: hypothetical protein WC494_02950 [Candidatus Pacearchaeota archaeon]
MKNKGQFFEIYLVVFMGFLCAFIIYTYFVQQSEARSSLVSPNTILELRDDLELFEIREKEIILETLKETKNTFEISDTFTQQFTNELIKKIKSEEQMKEFLFKDYIYENEARANEEDFIKSIYSAEYNEKEKTIILNRAKLEKRKYLNAKKENKINFPVEVSFTTSKTYLISFKENKFIIGEK